MTKRIKIRCLIALATLILMLSTMIIPSSAMTPLPNTHWSGSDAYGVKLPSNSEIVIESQTVTFDIQEMPAYNDVEKLKNYSGKVTTEYTLYNPTDREITLNLSLEIDSSIYYPVENFYLDAEKYSISLDGKEIDVQLRHGVNYQWGDEAMSGLATMVYDEYKSNEYISPDTTVTKYTYIQSGVTVGYAYVGFDLYKNHVKNTAIYLGEYGHIVDWNTGKVRLTTDTTSDNTTVEYFVLGDDLDHVPTLRAYDSPEPDNDDLIDGSFEFVGKETVSFSDYVFSYYNEGYNINEVDWYNMAAAEIAKNMANKMIFTNLYGLQTQFEGSRVSGFLYEITLATNQRVNHSIITPVYPDVEESYTPPTYRFGYRIPYNKSEPYAKEVEINVNTPYYLIEGEGFEKTDTGYTTTVNLYEIFSDADTYNWLYGVNFTLCEEENPEKEFSGISTVLLILLLVLIPVAIVVAVVYLVVWAVGSAINAIIGLFNKQ